MTFLNPLILFGLFLGFIPVLIHIFSKRKKDYVDFSSLRFLKILEMRRIRNLKLKQIILLILRTLAILFLVFAFARPSIKGKIGTPLESHTKISAVFILDNSFSAKQTVKGQVLYKTLKEMSVETARQFQKGDELFLIFSSDHENIFGPYSNPQMLINKIEQSSTTNLHSDLADVIKNAKSAFFSSSNIANEIFVFSDFQKTGTTSLKMISDSLRAIENFSLYLASPEMETPNNLSVTSVAPKNRLFELHSDLKIESALANFSDKAIEDAKLNFYLNNERTADAVTQLSPRQKSIREFSASITKPGYIDGFIEVEDNQLEADNRRYFTLFIPDKIKVLVLQDAPNPFLEINLQLSNEEMSTIECTFLPAKQSSTVKLSDYNVVLLNNISRFTSSDGIRFEKYLEWGGNIIFILNSRTNITEYNDFVAAPNSLPKALIKRTHGLNENTFLSFGRVDDSHPVLNTILNNPEKPYTSPRFFSSVAMTDFNNAQPIIKLSDGSPYVLEQKVNNGNVVILSSGLEPEQSDIGRRGIFVPLFQYLIRYLAAPGWNFKNDFIINEEVRFSLKERAQEFYLTTPLNEEIKIIPKAQADSYLLSFTGLTDQGIYKIYGDNKLLQQFSVNIDPKESDVERFTFDEIAGVLNNININSISSIDEIESILVSLRYGTELSSLVFFLVLFCLSAEMLIEKESVGRWIASRFKRH